MPDVLLPFEGCGGHTPLVTARGLMHDWHDAAGNYRHHVEQHFATFAIAAAGARRPDEQPSPLSIARAMLASAAHLPGCDALELRYLAEPRAHGATRVRMFVTAKSSDPYIGPQAAAAAATAAVGALPADLDRTPQTRAWMEAQPCDGDPIFELRRNEEVTSPTWDHIPADFYYHLGDRPGDGSGWRGFWPMLSRVTNPVTISILFKQTQLDTQERHVLGSTATDLALLAVTRQDVDLLGYPTTYPGCENAAVALRAWRERLELLQRPLLCRVAVRGEYTTALPIATSLASAIAACGEPGRVSPPMVVDHPVAPEDLLAAADGFDWLEIHPWGGSPLWDDPRAPRSLRRLPYLFGLDEAAGLAMLPVSDEQGVPGFDRSRRVAARRAAAVAAPSGRAVRLGELMHEGVASAPAQLPLTAINRHLLVVGAPGSGKTTTVLTMLASLWRDHGVPFLVIEPTKSEYRSLLRVPGVGDDLRVICLGREDVAPLRLNPLAPPPGVRMEVQANAVLAALKSALPLAPPLPQLLEDAIERAYRRAGWHDDTTSEDGITPPSLRTVLHRFTEVFEDAGYVGEARNVSAAMATRLRSLLRGSKGRVLDTVESVDLAELMTRPAVIELDEVADAEDKAVLASFLLDRIRADARRQGPSAGALRHVTVIEEAHRILANTAPASGERGEDPRAAAVEAFCNAIAELRSVGEGFILSSQSPSRLAHAAVDNCGSRILHHTESARDRDIVLADLDANQLEREATARLAVGEAIARWPPLEEPEFLQVQPGSSIDSSGSVTIDDVRQRMLPESVAVRRLLPYPLCTREVCTSGCDAGVRRTGDAIAGELARSAATIWAEHEGKVDALAPIASDLRREAAGDLQTAYCGGVHLAARGHALEVQRAVDIRPRLRRAIEDEPR